MFTVLEHHQPYGSVYAFGKAVTYQATDEMLHGVIAQIGHFIRTAIPNESVRPDRIILQRVPGARFPAQALNVVTLNHETEMHKRGWVVQHTKRADGMILQGKNIAVAVTSRDCPYLVLWFVQNKHCVATVTHCGRDQLFSKEGHSVIDRLFTALRAQGHAECVGGLITLGIRVDNFPNDNYPDLLSRLREKWGVGVARNLETGTIDLKELILAQLKVHGVPGHLVSHDGLDTFSDSRLASMRAGKPGHNMVIVHLKS